MNLKNFIGASSALLLTWLGATYMHQVPSERYPSQTRSTIQTAAALEIQQEEIVASVDQKNPEY